MKTKPSDRQKQFQGALLGWYDAHKRDLPWRRDVDPYRVLVSEFMLQQTTVRAVLPYFERWMSRFPTVSSLAVAKLDEVLSFWAGLGYYSRCRRLHASARWVVEHGWPQTVSDWLLVPGVGPYTAAAVGSISQGLAAPLVDGNVERVYARINGDPLTGASLKRAAWVWAESVMFVERPGDWNQSLMELGAVVCRPKNPDCPHCPVRRFCLAVTTGDPCSLPTKSAPPVQKEVHHKIWVPWSRGKFGILRTPDNEWWAGLWGFPRAAEVSSLKTIIGEAEVASIGSFVHTVTKHRIKVDVSLATCAQRSHGLKWVTEEELNDVGLPAPQRRAYQMALARIRSTKGKPSELYDPRDQAVNTHECEAVEA